MKTLRELLLETPKSECQKIFQKEIFGWLTKEKDTKIENGIEVNIVMNYFSSNGITKSIIDSFKKLKTCQKFYKKSLDTKNGIVVYRGLSDIDNNTKIIKSLKNVSTAKNKDFYVGDYIYKPHREIQSFTTNWKTAESFGLNIIKSIPIIFETKTTDDFIFTTDFTKWIDDQTGLDFESEVTRVSKKPIKGKIYVKKPIYKTIMKEEIK